MLAVALSLSGLPSFLSAALPVGPANPQSEVCFEEHVSPFLNDNCLACHCKTTTKGGLNLETRDLMLKGGDSGPAIVPGDPVKSLLFSAASHVDPDSAMPPKDNKAKAKNLSPTQLALLKDWIQQGAKIPPRAERILQFQPLPSHLKGILAVAVTPDGQYAACARANRLSIYHLPTGARVFETVAHQDQISSLAFSPDGLRLASGSFREIKLWRRDVEKKVPTTAMQAAERDALVASQPRMVAGADGSVTLQDAADGKVLATFKHGSEVTASAALPEFKRFATAGKNGTLKLWDEAGKLLAEQKGNRYLRESVGEHERALQVENGNVAAAKTALTEAEKFVEASKERLRKADNDVKNKQDAAAEKESSLSKLKQAKEAGSGTPPTDAVLSAAEEAFQKAGKAFADSKNEASLSKLESEKASVDLQTAKEALSKAEEVRNVAETALSTARQTAEAALRPIESLAFSKDGTLLAGRDTDGALYTWAARNAKPISVLSPVAPASARKPLYFKNDRLLCAEDEAGVAAWDLQCNWKPERQIGSSAGKSPISDRVCALAFSPDSKLLASGGGDPSREGELILWNPDSGALVKNVKRVHEDTILALEFSPDGKTLLSGAADKMARLVDIAQGKVVRTFEGHTGHVLSVSWHPDGRELASAGADNVVKIWSATTGLRKRNVEGYDKEVTSVRYLGASVNVLTSSGDSKVRSVSADGKELRAFPEPGEYIQALAVTRDAACAVAGGTDGLLRQWAVESGTIENRFSP